MHIFYLINHDFLQPTLHFLYIKQLNDIIRNTLNKSCYLYFRDLNACIDGIIF